MRCIGRVARLQVQRSRLKEGERGARRYDPAPLLEVDELLVGEAGAVGLTAAGPVVDVHHEDHPDSRNRRRVNGLSLLTLPRYAALRARYGDHLVDGVAGENLLLEPVDGLTPAGRRPAGHAPADLTGADLAGPLRLETAEGFVVLDEVSPAPPCVEFTRFVLRRHDPQVDDEVRTALADLDGGARGFYATVRGRGVVRAGARVYAG